MESRAAREKLKARGKPYYKSIDRGLHVGYRKGKHARQWVVRRYVGESSYVVETIGAADDTADADGLKVLDFWQAQELARDLARQMAPADGDSRGPFTVQNAIDDYLAQLGDGETEARQRLDAHVPYTMAAKEVSKLTTKELNAWLRHMASVPPRVRSRKGMEQAYRTVDFSDPETVRCRRYSANKVRTLLFAALNHSFNTRTDILSDTAWRKVKPFRGVSAARVRYLDIAEAKRLINASDSDFRSLVRAALETGCRYGELGRLRVKDFDHRSGTILIHRSKTDKPRHVVLTEDGQAFFAQLTVGRQGDDLMFGRQWKKSEQRRPMLAACKNARISPPAGFHILRHTWASHAVMNGTPLLVVAKNLGHSDTRMVEQHYGHLAPSHIADAIRAGGPRYGVVEPSNVTSI